MHESSDSDRNNRNQATIALSVAETNQQAAIEEVAKLKVLLVE